MPPPTVGPGPPIEPPLAGTPFTDLNSCAVSNCHRIFPSALESARSVPLQSAEKIAPGIAVTAAAWPDGPFSALGVFTNHFFSPVARFSAATPPSAMFQYEY